ncbi:hypothetical protein BDB01DRAFT_785518 [Pilobolus umbonatus]|nr:hypothetical protein BDB01DRAFT_785518 [Pilobolus umbonatus]
MLTDTVMEDIQQITKDGGVTKRIIKAGKGRSPGKKDSVCVHYDGYLMKTNTLFDSSRERKDVFTFDLSAHKVIEAWELVIPTMKVGEIAEIICTSDYGYRDEGRKFIVPPKAQLRFEVELIGFWTAAGTAVERIAAAQQKKEEGNELFKLGMIEQALFAYKKGREFIIELWNCEYEDLIKARDLVVLLHLNIGLCYLKMKEYDFCIEVCKKALDRDPTSLKAYYRLGQAYMDKGEFEESKGFINAGLQHKPMDVDLRALLVTVEEKEKKWKADSKKIYSKAFS